jgi:hypothetical protein
MPEKKNLVGKSYITLGAIFKSKEIKKSEEYFRKSLGLLENTFNSEYDISYLFNQLGIILKLKKNIGIYFIF